MIEFGSGLRVEMAADLTTPIAYEGSEFVDDVESPVPFGFSLVADCEARRLCWGSDEACDENDCEVGDGFADYNEADCYVDEDADNDDEDELDGIEVVERVIKRSRLDRGGAADTVRRWTRRVGRRLGDHNSRCRNFYDSVREIAPTVAFINGVTVPIR